MKEFFVISLMFIFFAITAYSQTADDAKYEEASEYYAAKEYDKAISILNELVTRDHAKALNLLGVCFGTGRGVEKDLDKAKYYYEKAADYGYTRSMVNLGWLYRSDDYSESHPLDDGNYDYYYKQAEKWFRMAARENDAAGFYGLAYLYESYFRGEDITARIEKAAPFFQKAAELNNGAAQIAVGYAEMRDGHYNTALEWFKKAEQNGCKENYGLKTDTWMTVCKFFMDNPQYVFFWNNDCCDFGHYIYEELDYYYVGALLNEKLGFLKLSNKGKLIEHTPFIYESDLEFPYYDNESHLFHVSLKRDGDDYGHDIIIDITGKEIKPDN